MLLAVEFVDNGKFKRFEILKSTINHICDGNLKCLDPRIYDQVAEIECSTFASDTLQLAAIHETTPNAQCLYFMLATCIAAYHELYRTPYR